MKHLLLFLIIQLTLLRVASSVYAESSVNINVKSNTGNNSINGQTVNSTSENYTNIKVNTNGETTEIRSDEEGEIKVRSINGKTTVETSPGMKVEVKSGKAVVKEGGVELSASISASVETATSEAVKKTVQQSKKQYLGVLGLIRQTIRNLFSLFNFQF